MTPPDPRALRNAFGTFITGVTVVTSHDRVGAPIGFTANSFTSVSLDPPLVLVCLAKTSSNYDMLMQAAGFAVNVLSEAQVELSNTFARPAKDRFADLTWDKGPEGSPVLDGVTAWFDCKMHKTVDAGDHAILIGEVMAFDSGREGLRAHYRSEQAQRSEQQKSDLQRYGVSPIVVRTDAKDYAAPLINFFRIRARRG